MIKTKLIEAAQNILHSGDYGHLWWNEKEKKVHWTAGDGDFKEEEGETSYEDVRKMFLSIDGVDSVEIEEEWDPTGDDWERIEFKSEKQSAHEWAMIRKYNMG